MFKDLIADAKTFGNFVARNVFWIALIAVGLFVIGTTTKALNVVFMIILVEGLALGLSELAQYVYTKVNFKEGNQSPLGFIFLGVHILAGLVTFGIYFIQFAATAQ